MSLMKKLNSIGPSMDPCGTPLANVFYLDIDCNSLDVAIHPVPYPFNIPSTNAISKSVAKMLWGILSNVVQ